jgi:hypothetical protein
MNLPSGLVFFLDFKYGKSASQGEGFGANNSVSVPGGAVDSLQGRTGPNTPSGSSAPYGVGGLYGEGRYDYSIQVQSASYTPGDGTAATYGSASANYKDINFNQEFSQSMAASELWKVSFLTSNLSNPDLKAARAFTISGSASASLALPQFTKVSSDNSTISFIVSASAPGEGTVYGGLGGRTAADTALQDMAIEYSVQPTEADRGDFEDIGGDATKDSLSIPEVDLQMRS